jgi:hypothetical protein
MFMGRLVCEPDDIRIFGRAIAREHRPGRDDATSADIALRPWKQRWPCYIRVRDAEFLDGTMTDGVSLNELMDELGSETWTTTSRRAAETGRRDIDPRKSLSQQTQLELTVPAIGRLNKWLEQCFARNGKIAEDRLAELDWPAGSSSKGSS